MSGHTSGPWFPVPVAGDGRWGDVFVSSNCDAQDNDLGTKKNGGVFIARTTGPDAAANARLIAAAPEMFEAIEQALDDMGEDGHCVCEAAKQLLRAAIAKAPEEAAK